MNDYKDFGGYDDWILWNGGACPVESGVTVEIILRDEVDGHELFTTCPDKADYWDWTHLGDGADIVAYRIVKESP